MPCPASMWCAVYNDRLSASLINKRVVRTYTYAHAHAQHVYMHVYNDRLSASLINKRVVRIYTYAHAHAQHVYMHVYNDRLSASLINKRVVRTYTYAHAHTQHVYMHVYNDRLSLFGGGPGMIICTCAPHAHRCRRAALGLASSVVALGSSIDQRIRRSGVCAHICMCIRMCILHAACVHV